MKYLDFVWQQNSSVSHTNTTPDLSCEGTVHQLEQVSEEVAVGVLAELVQDEPVAEIAVTEDVLAGWHVRGGEAPDLDDDEEPPDGGHEDGDEPEEEVSEGDQGQPEHPEPEQQVDLINITRL